ncbi:MAG: SDR family oxidoreductase [Burkholderiaceae bacterium]
MNPPHPCHLLVAGASGIIGQAAVEHFSALPGWTVTALSRRRGDWPASVKHLAVDLTDAQACHAHKAEFAGVTHVLYSALFELPDLVSGWRDAQQMATNLAMLKHLLDALEPAAQGLAQITLMQGAKAYGTHIEPAPIPAKERWPRHAHENFYWLQEDLVRERQARSVAQGRPWHFCILRPQVVLGHAPGSPMNVVAAIGAFAAIRRELGLPLVWPGGGRFVSAASDSRLIAQAVEFAATSPNAANQTYNIVNGDALAWQDLWPAVARHFGMPLGAPEPIELAKVMPEQEAVWSRIVQRYGLRASTLQALIGSSWQFTDRSFAHGNAQPAHSLLSPIKLKQAGFTGCVDTEDALIEWMQKLQRDRWLPG